VECFIIQGLRVRALHGWEVSVALPREIQLSLAKKVVTENEAADPPQILGALSFPESLLIQAACGKIGNIPDLILLIVKRWLIPGGLANEYNTV
jgi:hypothetical protein